MQNCLVLLSKPPSTHFYFFLVLQYFPFCLCLAFNFHSCAYCMQHKLYINTIKYDKWAFVNKLVFKWF